MVESPKCDTNSYIISGLILKCPCFNMLVLKSPMISKIHPKDGKQHVIGIDAHVFCFT